MGLVVISVIMGVTLSNAWDSYMVLNILRYSQAE
jgi:hypothetical protein